MANAKSESGFNPANKGGAGEIGLWQFLGTEQKNYLAWLKKNHPDKNWTDPTVQAEYMPENLKKNYPNLWKELTGHTPAGQQAADYVSGYEHPAKRYEMQRRAAYLKGVPPPSYYTGSEISKIVPPPKTVAPQRKTLNWRHQKVECRKLI